MCKYATAREVWGHAPPENFWNLEASGTTFGLLGGQTKATEFQMYAYCVVQHWFWLSDRSLTLQATPFADEAWKNKLG